MKGLALCFVFLFISLYGQRYISSWYNIDNGLPQSSAKDTYGFICITTENGLVRYDGASFITNDKFQINHLHFGDFTGTPVNDSIIIYNTYEEKKILIKNRFPRVFNEKKETKILSKDGDHFLKRIVKNFVAIKLYSAHINYVQMKSGRYYCNYNYIIYKDQNNTQKKIHIAFHSKDLSNLSAGSKTLFINDPVQKKNAYFI
ncbi:hypothetical protein M2347_003222 [Chryseobacterium sp. H1D6B]|uniref:hypothetical protein n=1 Tax=Chryseobacterium sp. H1D6B TaxID=2940588 RepID=UPI0015C89083|nr:hypothetical protein [Chryseobacterium sp. H1D6B]MDH6253495.1 hypothetical protein [Chryseobacterium sp. H1D6B]